MIYFFGGEFSPFCKKKLSKKIVKKIPFSNFRKKKKKSKITQKLSQLLKRSKGA
jgi:hypothetical protein